MKSKCYISVYIWIVVFLNLSIEIDINFVNKFKIKQDESGVIAADVVQ